MGQLIYAGSSYDISDLGLVALDALTRRAFSEGKSFTLILRGASEEGDVVARSLWMSPHVPLQFLYEGYETIQIPRAAFAEMYKSVIDTGIHLLGDGPLPYEFTGERPGGDSD
ncbi:MULTISPECIES: hypothetical protein [Mycobacteroides]|uniref:DUF7882 domain-containing protein n=1 Tax=Mycobacteroides chelonae TaxID=1774 RepID=A0AB73TXZ5_MYCCH|nr:MULTISPECIES: hypothetical protein [Mycobacteroides]QDF69415.1 hypothetical protein FJK96_04010 [Mycobacteroides chelonae]CPR84195.1 Uncharacterised protein [Mycobacteroides abscessus]CPS03699.1 Uncharacterised protein [Mycobacteroides abscessus]CPT03908.1 Uncharacterised protein [Mycobacteroides abscessus]CPU33212.1 Uncharacterised protein [Mycobacteroides abscessus]